MHAILSAQSKNKLKIVSKKKKGEKKKKRIERREDLDESKLQKKKDGDKL